MKERINDLLSSWGYMLENIYYYFTHKGLVDDKIKEYLWKRYDKDEYIVVAVHGIFEYYWQSFPKYMDYFERKGKSLIPISYNYMKSNSESVEKIRKDISHIHKITGKEIVLIGDSEGATIISRYMLKYNPDFIREFISLAGVWGETKGVAFWWYWFAKTPKSEMRKYWKLFHKGVPKLKTNFYAKWDAFINKEHRTLERVNNIELKTGHFGILYDKDVIEQIYEYIFPLKKIEPDEYYPIKPIYKKMWEMAKPFYKEGRPMDLAHVSWMMKDAAKVCEKENLDDSLLMPLVILHDVGYAKSPKDNPFKLSMRRLHMAEGAKLASDILKELNYPKDKIKKIEYYISVHDNWAFKDFEPYKKDKILAVFNDLDFMWMATKKGFEETRKIRNESEKDMYNYVAKNDKLTDRPFATKTTKELFKEYMEEILEKIKND